MKAQLWINAFVTLGQPHLAFEEVLHSGIRSGELGDQISPKAALVLNFLAFARMQEGNKMMKLFIAFVSEQIFSPKQPP